MLALFCNLLSRIKKHLIECRQYRLYRLYKYSFDKALSLLCHPETFVTLNTVAGVTLFLK